MYKYTLTLLRTSIPPVSFQTPNAKRATYNRSLSSILRSHALNAHALNAHALNHTSSTGRSA
ncbi:hypothetical protein GGP51_001873 [Salinibacter ruber]|nr:hypothetical protein [Salinibacter ruber]MCS4182592.1 hypothetical protein [Salinibacter ruber]MCS4190396.1 hypothetical protein [Salinibacter ruber]